jgi:hypothetical protein
VRWVAGVLIAVLLASCSGAERGPRRPIYTIRYEVDACCADTIPEISYVPYWSPAWGLENRFAYLVEDPAVPWKHVFSSDHFRRLTVRAYGDVGLECRVFVDGELVDERRADTEVACAVRPPPG